ncbi:MAG: ABC transporter permease [Actinomycetota bacterium]|nr:ABC transporter permease [Actinomycetota bacterium]
MISVTLRGLAGRKLRSALTAIAIVLGVAMISGTYVLTDTIDKAFSQIFEESYAGTDVVVKGQGADIEFQGETADDPPVSEAVLERVRTLPGVELAMGGVYDETNTKILTKEGKAVETNGAPSLGFGIDTSPEYARFNPLTLVDGRWPSGGNEVVIDEGTADKQGYAVGDTIRISTLQPAREFELAGIARYGEVSSLGTATFAVFETATAQELLDREGKFDLISVAGKDGVTPQQLIREIRPVLPASAEVATGAAQANEESEEISEFTKFIEYFLLAFAGIALFVGAFVIFNTLSITVAQRTREFATVRTIGGSRRQVLASVILEALVIGILASLIGLFAGLGLAIGLNTLFTALELDLPQANTVFATRTIVVSLLIGIIVTLLASLVPALRATRVPPIAAVREGATLPPSRFSRFTPYIGLAMIALSVALLAWSLFADEMSTSQRLLSIAGGVLALFLGVGMLSSRLVKPLAAVLGLPARRIGGAAGRLAQANSLRNPGRTAATAAALMIGVALVTFVAVLANGMKASNRGAIEDQVRADFVITSQDGFTPFVGAAGDAVETAPEAALATDVRSELGKAADSSKYVTGIEPRRIATAYRFDWEEGSNATLGELGTDGAIIDKDFADEKDLAVGERFELLVPSGKTVDLEVRGIYKPPPFYPLLGSVSINKTAFDELYERPRNQFTFVNVLGSPNQAKQAGLEQALASFPDAKVQTREGWIDQQDEDFNQFLTMLYVLLALSVIVSIFGMVNTLVLSVFERTRELGMLRAVGMTRRQVRRMVRHESVITALIGAALGVPLGIFLAALVTSALSQFEIEFSVPIGWLVAVAIIAVVVGIVAALMPARRAARLNVLEALQYE